MVRTLSTRVLMAMALVTTHCGASIAPDDGGDAAVPPPMVGACAAATDARACSDQSFQDESDALRCYTACSSDADCHDPCQPHCAVQGLYRGGDYQCNGHILVCRATAEDDCH